MRFVMRHLSIVLPVHDTQNIMRVDHNFHFINLPLGRKHRESESDAELYNAVRSSVYMAQRPSGINQRLAHLQNGPNV